ncbi:MAG: hypothetical protein R3B54_07395 [Bdellovibrionota bacterium]
MKRFYPRLFLVFVGLVWSSTGRGTCPNDEGLRRLLNSEIQTAAESISSFQGILESRPTANPVPISKLIFIDLNDETAVTGRLEELRRRLALPPQTLGERFPDCKQFTKSLTVLQQAQEAQTTQLMKLKATFLNLPRERRRQLLETFNTHLAQLEVSKRSLGCKRASCAKPKRRHS